MRKIFLIVFLVMAVGTAMLMVAPVQSFSAPPGHSKASCSNRTGVGTYGYNCGGVAPNVFKPIVNPDGSITYPVEPFAGYGVVIADGTGQWNGYGKVSINGKVVKWTHDTRPNDPSIVNPDCTGEVTYAVTITDGAATFPAPDAHFEFAIVDDGKEVKGFPVDAGYAVSCQLTRTHSD